ncbi:HAMP domain-containing sensor histidine kinase [uncultured Desulfovibrio sp.]|uniref:sensor histidine kinase n=1 Tax=uncultured Desulfovibrio sp. TaxID=167968 RepID=UPI002602034C|nr:HAMP domain-containing sensor histidine kinase [uncultured Desulfovibrio sp.]
MSGGSSIRRRLLASFMLLAAGLGLTMGMVGLLAHDRLGAHLVDWYARPIMNALIEAEERSRRAEDRGRHNNLVYGADLAALMDLQFRVGKQIPAAWRGLEPGLHFFERMEDFVLLEQHKGVRYALSGHTGLLVTIKGQLARVLGLCAVLGLGVAALLAFLLSRRLTGQLTALTRTVSRCPVPRAGGDYPGLPPLPQVELRDEVGVLARAIASREAALRRFVQRESFFTGDVSHELRTPLTVMQGGLEVLELQLESLPGAERCTPTVERLQRTVRDMAATVGVLLLLARRPENIEPEPVDLALLVRECAQGQDCFALDLPATQEVQAQAALARIVVKNLLDNARLYSENGRVAVRLDADALQVRNAGRIPEDLDIFARGVRVRARGDATPGGSGLGLSLVRRACEQLGWSVTYRHSGENETLFEVRFAPDDHGEQL